MNRRAEVGERAETLARCWLEERGLRTVQSNFRCRHGELDLVMHDGELLVIVEVRARRSTGFVTPAVSVDWRKQRRIICATQFFLQAHPRYADDAIRFDVVAVTGTDVSSVDWIRDAFSAD